MKVYKLKYVEDKKRQRHPIKAIATCEYFMGVMRDFLVRQESDPNFDPRTEWFDMYEALMEVYDNANKPWPPENKER